MEVSNDNLSTKESKVDSPNVTQEDNNTNDYDKNFSELF